jgi:hypothetical protein
MVCKQEPDLFPCLRIDPFQLVADQLFEEDLLLDPDGDGRQKGSVPPGGEGVVGFQEAFEFQEGLVVENDGVQIGQADPGLFEAEGDGPGGEAGVVLFPGEAFLLGGRGRCIRPLRRAAAESW